MRLKLRFVAFLLTTLMTTGGGFPGASASASAQGGDPSGLWLTQAGDAKVRISRCGEGICGVVVSLREPIDAATGAPFVDDKNPNPALRRRPTVGLPLFSDMRPTGPGTWAGRIYNADDGGVYDSNIAVVGPNALRVNGCIGALCGGETWTRTRR